MRTFRGLTELIPAKQPEQPKLVKAPEPKPPESAAALSKPMPLFSELEMGDFRSQWRKVQTGFVDEPRKIVEEADMLVAVVMQRLADCRDQYAFGYGQEP